ncbi:hypothetical protein [Streptomyces rochei]|uniref:hypothetical protein n=1 Tax=Streptomyces rochei TaxID=1928 RepID=UPI0036FE8552
MSDHRRGLPHDLPEYVPNWPVAIKTKAAVLKGRSGWFWTHICLRKGRSEVAIGYASQPEAFADALKHARGCW